MSAERYGPYVDPARVADLRTKASHLVALLIREKANELLGVIGVEGYGEKQVVLGEIRDISAKLLAVEYDWEKEET